MILTWNEWFKLNEGCKYVVQFMILHDIYVIFERSVTMRGVFGDEHSINRIL